jgi:hypothetical protein
LQGDGEHHDDSDKLTLHGLKLNRRGAPRQTV